MNVSYPELPDGYYWHVRRMRGPLIKQHPAVEIRKRRVFWFDKVVMTRLYHDLNYSQRSTLEVSVQALVNYLYERFSSEQERESEWSSLRRPGQSTADK